MPGLRCKGRQEKVRTRLCVLLVRHLSDLPVYDVGQAAQDQVPELRFLAVPPHRPRFQGVTDVCLREGCGYKELVKEGLSPEETEKRRKMREARAAKAAERAAAKEAAEKNGETEEKVKKVTKKAAVKKSTAKKTLPWMTKTTNKFKKLKDEAVQELTAKQQEQYAKALAKYEAEKAAEKAKKAAEKKAAAKKPAAKKKTTAKESAE